MATNEAAIANWLATLTARVDADVAAVTSYLEDVYTLATEVVTIDDAFGLFDFTIPDTNPTNSDTAISAILDQVSGYPDMAEGISLLTAGKYDSDFLVYLETSCKNTPYSTWAATINNLRDTYRQEVATLASNYASQFVPLPSGYATAFTTLVSDKSTNSAADFVEKYIGLVNDIAVTVQQDALKHGIAIEDVRERNLAVLSGYYNSYYNAQLEMHRAEFQSILEQMQIIRKNIGLYIDQHLSNEEHVFKGQIKEQETQLLEIDKFLTKEEDNVRQQHSEWRLRSARLQELIRVLNQQISSAHMADGTFSIYNSTSED